MVTDTAFYRYRHYHSATDTPDRIDYVRMAKVVEGLVTAVEVLAGDRSSSAPDLDVHPFNGWA
jgi:hypothetical protein